MVGIEGNVVGMVGSGVAGNGGRGTAGMVGSVGFGKAVGIWALGSGGNAVGIVGSGCGWVAWGTVGIAGNGGNATLGNAGIVGMVGGVVVVWSRFRAPRLVWMVEKDRTMMRERTKLEAAIV